MKHAETSASYHWPATCLVLAFICAALLVTVPAAGSVPLAPAELIESNIAALGKEAQLLDLGQTASGRRVLALHFPSTGGSQQPALAIVGGLGRDASLAGSWTTIGMAKALAANTDPAVVELRRRVAVFVLALPSPDCFSQLRAGASYPSCVNTRPTDDDRDGRLDEDGPEDLNGDGEITSMRVKDPAGQWRAHPLDPRILIPVKPELGETGEYSLYSEGSDNDGDGRFNEDGPGGVDFNQNWSWNYPENQPGSGPWPLSEPEARAVADLLFDHPEIALVYSLGPQDNLAYPWQAGNDGGRIKTGVLAGDAPLLKFISERYKESFDTSSAPKGEKGDGSFGYWAYFHFGRWSLMAQPWWVPEVKATPAAETANPDAAADQTADATAGETDPPKWDPKDERGKEELAKLHWVERQGQAWFADWQAVEHPDFPGRVVEVGGFRDSLHGLAGGASDLTAETCAGRAAPHLAFLEKLTGLLPRLTIDNLQATALGDGVWRVEARVVNSGFLPSFSEMGELSRQHQRLQAELDLPAEGRLLMGLKREALPRLAGSGGSHELSWLLSGLSPGTTLQLRVGAPAVGSTSAQIVLKP